MRLRNLTLLAVFSLLTTLSLRADTTYTYTGNSFASFSDPYSSSDFVSGSITLSSPLGNNLSGASLAPIAFSFTDGVNAFTNTTPSVSGSFHGFDTDASGNITRWNVFVFIPGGYSLRTGLAVDGETQLLIAQDAGQFGSQSANVVGNRGTWSLTAPASPVPEPSSIALLGTGVLALAGAARRRVLTRS